MPVAGGNILGIDLANLPMSGTAWNRVVARAGQSGSLNLSSTSAENADLILAKAIVAARTGNATMRQQVINMIAAAVGTENGTRSLEVARNAAPIVIAANLIGYHGHDSWFRSLRDTAFASQGSLINCNNVRPNNWGTACGQSRIAIDMHLGDTTDLARAYNVFAAWTCEPGHSNSSFKWDFSGNWQADTSHPCGINRAGTSRSGVNLDGIQPEDQRRASAFPSFSCENYVWQASGEALLSTRLLTVAGYNASSLGDAALKRSYLRYQGAGCTAAGDDRWQIPMANRLFGLHLTTSGMDDGKSFGFTDYLFGS